MSFERLSKWDALAWVAGLALLFVTAIDWYSTKLGDAARQIQHDVNVPQGPIGSEIPSTIKQQAGLVANGQEKNLWQLHAGIDRLILIVLLAAAVCAAFAAAMRVADRRYKGTFTPSAAAALLSGFGAALVLYRLVNQPGDNQLTTVKSGPWLAFIALGLLCLGASLAWRAERDGTAWRDEPAAGAPKDAAPA
jgi:hypothetical protein